jgi:hypothetical protein
MVQGGYPFAKTGRLLRISEIGLSITVIVTNSQSIEGRTTKITIQKTVGGLTSRLSKGTNVILYTLSTVAKDAP